jgi:hypothetical protein
VPATSLGQRIHSAQFFCAQMGGFIGDTVTIVNALAALRPSVFYLISHGKCLQPPQFIALIG